MTIMEFTCLNLGFATRRGALPAGRNKTLRLVSLERRRLHGFFRRKTRSDERRGSLLAGQGRTAKGSGRPEDVGLAK